MNTTRLFRTARLHGWRSLPSLLIPAALALLAAAPGHAALVQVTMAAVAENTFVGGGDPCGTGQTGGNACNGEALTIDIVIDTDAAPADQDDAADRGSYLATTSPGFITANLTINGHLFLLPADASMSFNQSVEMVDDLDGSSIGLGLLDRVEFVVSGDSASQSFSASPKLLMSGDAFTGDALATLGTIAGSPLAISGIGSLSNGAFSVSNATGQVSGQYRPSLVSFSTVPAPPVGWMEGTALTVLLGRGWRQRSRALTLAIGRESPIVPALPML